jgi:hypothetical protein
MWIPMDFLFGKKRDERLNAPCPYCKEPDPPPPPPPPVEEKKPPQTGQRPGARKPTGKKKGKRK